MAVRVKVAQNDAETPALRPGFASAGRETL